VRGLRRFFFPAIVDSRAHELQDLHNCTEFIWVQLFKPFGYPKFLFQKCACETKGERESSEAKVRFTRYSNQTVRKVFIFLFGARKKNILILRVQKTEVLFSSQKILQNFSDSPSHRIFIHMHEALNIDKK
jgi:hypothetical protein